MSCDVDDTIAAIATPAGGAARAAVRLSGPNVLDCLRSCFTPNESIDLASVTVARVIEGTLPIEDLSSVLPCDLYFWPTSQSYTRQPVAELHTIGSPPLLESLLASVCAAGARLAQPGEFTLRAFLAGRLDLAQAEAVLGVIDAGSQRGFEIALEQLAGGISRPLTHLRNQLVDLLADLEAGLDFVDEDIEFVSTETVQRQLTEAAHEVEHLIGQMAVRSRSSDAVRIVLVGSPNVGKSSLFNALAEGSTRRQRIAQDPEALVSPRPGTTRDYLVAELDFQGTPFELVDMAGVDESVSAETIDTAAQSMTSGELEHCDVKLLCLDTTRPATPWELEAAASSSPVQVIALTKVDASEITSLDFLAPRTCRVVATSSRTAKGIGSLRSALAEAALRREKIQHTSSPARPFAAGKVSGFPQSPWPGAQKLAADSEGEELVAAEIRVALTELGKVVGEVYTDDVLDRIFSRFCIGK